MRKPITFEIKLSITVSEDGSITPVTKVFVDSEQIGMINRVRIDQDSDDFLPSIEIDMLRGHQMDLIGKEAREKAQEFFKLLQGVPGVKCVMPAPRK